MYSIYKETWEDSDGLRLDIAFTEFERTEMPKEYILAKRRHLAEEHGFNINDADLVMIWKTTVNNNV